jgi:ABC-type cobalamin transport system permease subunit
MIQSAFVALMGAVFVWWGLSSGEGMMFVAVMGAVFLTYGLVQFYRMSRLVPPADHGNPGGRAT